MGMISDALIKKLTAPPKLDGIKKALFIQPHPDDNEIGAGGVMAYLVSKGAEVWELTVTDDRLDCGADGFKGGLTVRQREALAAMKTLGVQNAGFLGFADKAEASVTEISDKILPVIRRLRPDAVFSVDPTLPNECHRDHIRVGWAVRYAVMDAECDFYPRLPGNGRHGDVWKTPILGQYFTASPNVIADIGAHWKLKCGAIRCHKSQVSAPLMAALDIQSRYFGEQGGCKRGEALRLLNTLELHCFNLPV